MRHILAAAAVGLLAGCATTAGYEKMLTSWVGSSEIELVRRWGPPASSYDAGGHRFIVYNSQRNIFMPGVAPSFQTTVIGNTAFTNQVGGVAPMNIGLVCTTTFELESDRVVSWQYQGNDCKARNQ